MSSLSGSPAFIDIMTAHVHSSSQRCFCTPGTSYGLGFRRDKSIFWNHDLVRCEQKPQCTRGQFRTIGIHTCHVARQKAYEVAKTPEFAVALRQRRKVEALFSELKNQIGLRRLRLRRIKFVREQFYLAAVAQNLKRLVRFLNMRAQPAMATA